MDDDRWPQAREARRLNPPGSYFDRSQSPAVDLFRGYAQISYRDRVLFHRAPPNASHPASHQSFAEDAVDLQTWVRESGIGIGLADLAERLSVILDGEAFGAAPDVTVARYSESGHLSLTFARSGENVTIRSDGLYDQDLTVPLIDFLAGIRRFVERFAAELRRRAPEAVEWETLAALRPGEAGVTAARAKAGAARRPRPWHGPVTPLGTDATEVHGANVGATRLAWWLDPAAWEEARRSRRIEPPGSLYDQGGLPRGHLLLGWLELTHGESQVLPRPDLVERASAYRQRMAARGVVTPLPPDLPPRAWARMELADLACQVALLPDAEDAPKAQSVYRVTPVRLSVGGQAVALSFSLRAALGPAVGQPGVLEVCRAFTADFVGEMAARAPEVLDWDTFAPLRPYLPRAADPQ